MKLLALLPIAATAVSMSADADLNGVKESLRAIAVNAHKDGKQINMTTKNVVDAMVNAINHSLTTALVVDKAAAQSALDSAEADVLACLTARTTTFDVGGTTGIAEKDTTAQAAETSFHECKELDDNALLVQDKHKAKLHHRRHHTDPDGSDTTSNHDWGYNFTRTWHADGELSHTSHESHAHTEEARLCKIVNDTVRGFEAVVRPIATSDYCETPNPSNWTDLFRTNTKMWTGSNAWFTHMDTFETNNAQKYKDEREACHLARSRHQIRVAECGRLQTAFEGAFCNWANSIDETCYLYESCYNATYATYLIQNTTAKAIQDQMHRQQEALELLTCYADEIRKDSTDLSACDAIGCTYCPQWDLIYEDPHGKVGCTEEQNDFRPCSDGFCTAKYEDYFTSSTPVAQCTACADPNLVAWSA